METEQIKEINQHISDALEQWQYIMLKADADQLAYKLNYSRTDVLNVIYMFNHVLSNVGIKNGTIDMDVAETNGEQIRSIVKDMTGYDTHELVQDTFNK